MPSEAPFRMIRRPLDWELSAAEVLRRVRADPHPVALLGAWAGGSDIVASDPVRTCCAPEPCTDVLDEPLPDLPRPAASAAAGSARHLGFGLAGQVLPVPPSAGRAPATARLVAGLLRPCAPPRPGHWPVDVRGACGRPAVPPRWSSASVSCRGAGRPPQPRAYSCGGFRLIPSADEHRSRSAQAISYIRRGDIFQANICLRLEAGIRRRSARRVLPRGHPARPALRRVPAGPRRGGGQPVARAVPAPRRAARSGPQPIKGTRPRPDGRAGRARGSGRGWSARPRTGPRT